MKNTTVPRAPLREARGARVPALGIGTWELEDDLCQEVVETALELGYRHVDTARIYGNEAAVGRALSRSGITREEIFVTTKLFLDDLSRTRVPRAVEDSLATLGAEYVDLVLVHWPHPEVPIEETLEALQEVKRAGLVRQLGVSNFTLAQLEKAQRRAPLFCNQVEFHPYLDQGELLASCRADGMLLTAYSPLAQGGVAGDETLARVGSRHGKSATQVALRWLLQQEAVLAVPKSRQREHLAANLDVFDFELSDEEMKTVAGLARGQRLVDPDFAPSWDE